MNSLDDRLKTAAAEVNDVAQRAPLPVERSAPVRPSWTRMPAWMAAGAAAALVLVALGVPLVLFGGGGDSDGIGQTVSTVALTGTTVPPTSVPSTTSTTTAASTTVAGITNATEAMLAGLLHRLDDAYLRYTSPSEEDYPSDWETIGDLEDAIYVAWAPIVVELLDAMETVSANLETLSDSGGLYEFEEGVDELVVAVDEWLVASHWYNDLNCFPLLPEGARDLEVGELWNQTEWADCMNANITAEDMDDMRQKGDLVKELLDSLMLRLGADTSG